jgi:hypothetical protein
MKLSNDKKLIRKVKKIIKEYKIPKKFQNEEFVKTFIDIWEQAHNKIIVGQK